MGDPSDLFHDMVEHPRPGSPYENVVSGRDKTPCDTTRMFFASATGSIQSADDRSQGRRVTRSLSHPPCGEVFVVADGQPLSRREICEAAVASKRYGEKATMPRFEVGSGAC